MTKDTQAGSPGVEQARGLNASRSRRTFLQEATATVVSLSPAARALMALAGGAVVGGAEAACAKLPNSKPETPAQTAVDASLKLFDQVMSAPGYITQDQATSLVPAAIHAGDVQPALSAFKALKGSTIDGTYIGDDQAAGLAAVSVIQGITTGATKDAFKTAHSALTKRSSDGWGSSLDDSFNSKNDVTDATNMVGLSPLYNGGLDEVIGVFEGLGHYASNTGNDKGKSIVENNPGLVALAMKLNELRTGTNGTIDGVVRVAVDLFPSDNLTLSENNFDQVAQEAGILALATAFKGDETEVRRTYKDMSSRFSDEKEIIPFVLTLASAIDGFNSSDVADMYSYAKGYRSDTTTGIDDSLNAARIVLSTAAKDAVDKGRIPPELADVTTNMTGILIGIAIWWYFFGPKA